MLRAGKTLIKRRAGNTLDDDLLLHEYYARKKLERDRRKNRKWKLAAATASDRFLLIGKPQR